MEITVAIGTVDAEIELVNVVNCACISLVTFFNLSNIVAEILFIFVINSNDLHLKISLLTFVIDGVGVEAAV